MSKEYYRKKNIDLRADLAKEKEEKKSLNIALDLSKLFWVITNHRAKKMLISICSYSLVRLKQKNFKTANQHPSCNTMSIIQQWAHNRAMDVSL